MGDCCRELTTVLSSRTRTGNIWFPSKIRYQLSYASLTKSAHKSCKRTFFKDSYLNSQPLIPSTPVESEALLTPNFSSTDQSLGLRKSSRQSLQYKSNQAERKCIICNKDRYTKDQWDHLQSILLERTVDVAYKAEDTLKEYDEIQFKSTNANDLLTVPMGYF